MTPNRVLLIAILTIGSGIRAYEYRKTGLSLSLRGAYISPNTTLRAEQSTESRYLPDTFTIDVTLSETKVNLVVTRPSSNTPLLAVV